MSAQAAAAGPVGRSRWRLWRDLLGLLKELWLAQPALALATLGLLLLGNARAGLYVTAAGGVVAALTGAPAGGHGALFWLGVYIGASALEEFHWTVSPIVSTALRDHAAFRLQSRVLERAAAAPLRQFEEGPFFAHVQRATAGTGERLAGLFNQLTSLAATLVHAAALAAALAVVQPLLLPLLIAGALPALWLQARSATAVYQARHAHAAADRVRTQLERLLTGRAAAAELRLFGAASFLIGRWRRLRAARTRDIVAAEGRRAWAGALSGVCSGAAYAGALALTAVLILRGQLTIGNYVTVLTGALWFEGAVGELVRGVRGLEEESQFLGDLLDFWRAAEIEGDEQDTVASAPVLHPPIPNGMAVEAAGVTFRYPGAAEPALRGVDLRLAPGEKVALVGENGAGKSTLVRVLIGLYRPDEGLVRLDGQPPTPVARRRIAAVFQDYASFALTARENIGFGDLARLGDDAALRAAAEQAGVGVLVADLPGGFDAYLGREFGERDLSGGQWQRLALARACFRAADLLVLDEPTAALDPLAELALFERFADLAVGRTAIMISHRLGMARLAARVVVLHEGRVVEDGRHADLLARGGRYARMFAAQARWYR